MKRKLEQREPSRASLREIPPVDFNRYEVGCRNPFAKRMKAEGWELLHEGPSRASLREIPPLGGKAAGRANPYAERIKAQGIELQVGRRRPARGSEVGPTEVKSVRLPPEVWKRLERQARAEGIALHAPVRVALLEWLGKHVA
jgi:hypothetical protein